MHRSNYRSFTNRATVSQLKKLSELYLSSVHAAPQGVSHLPQFGLVAGGGPIIAGLLTLCVGGCLFLSRCRHCAPLLTVSCEGDHKNQPNRLIHRQAIVHPPGELIDA